MANTVQSFNEMPRRAARHRGNAGACERAASGDRAGKRLSPLGDGRDRCAGAFGTNDLNPAVAQDKIFRIGFQHLAGKVEQLLAHFAARGEARGAERHCCPAAADPNVISGGVRIGWAHNHIFRPNAQRVGDDLRQRLHHRARADLDARRHQRGAAVRIEVHCRRRGADEDEPGTDSRAAAIQTIAGKMFC